nr:pyrimidine dimer DNA glycosylase/endonuclease V [Agromyces seonyuensis]
MHPRFLDRQGLTACWREALLAQAVLAGRTAGYRRHPQLERFRAGEAPLDLVGAFLAGVADEATARGYRFDRTRIDVLRVGPIAPAIDVSDGQLDYEWGHLLRKLRTRSPERALDLEDASPAPHPLFRVVPGPLAAWERP